MKRAGLVILACVLLLAMPALAQSSISYGDTVSGTISDTSDVELWEFEGTAGDVVNITMIADEGSGLDTRLFLYTAAGHDAGEPAIAENDDSGDATIGTFNSFIENFSLPETTTYVIEATRFGSGTGDYELTLNAGDTSIAGVDEGAIYQFIEYGMQVGGTINDTFPSETWEFVGDEGDVITITMIADESGTLDPRLYLYDVDGEIEGGVAIAENDDSGDSSIGIFNSRIENFELPADGFYYIEASRFTGEGDYTLTLEAAERGVEIRQWASSATATSQYGDDGWSATQATGEPDTFDCGDIRTAWASSSSTGVDALTVEFDTPVRASEINIYETYNPGSIVRVEISNTNTGLFVELPDSADPVDNTPCPGVFTLAVPEVDMLVDSVIIYVDQTIGGSWNEIDAVELVGIDPDATPEEDPIPTVQLEIGELVSASYDYADGSVLEIDSPEGLLTSADEAGFFYIANSQSVLEAIQSGSSGAMEDGAFGVTVTMPGTFAEPLGLDPDTPALEALNAFATAVGSTGTVEEYTLVNDTAAYTELVDSVAPVNTHIIAVDNSDGVVFVAIQLGQDVSFADLEGIIIDIINSIQYTPASN